ncbi:DUF302 domain-containing protein [Granulicella arctica]|uniref:DUF302 domain-containing protein n=1 Tax=Granulicella arctica TaxID=940613 RepID=UPI0021DF57BF|nr:DUF302 domain-containing protein [Granulicella arctica]
MESPSQVSGLITIASNHSVDETVARLTDLLAAKSIKLFALIDHSGEAEAVGLHMPPTKVMIFGSPKSGTPLMLASPSVAIDLPLKLLIAADLHGGKVTISYNSTEYLRDRHHLLEEHLTVLNGIGILAAKAAA